MKRNPQTGHVRSAPHAFTLLELLVVLGTLTMLAAVLFPAFARTASSAGSAQCQKNLKQIAVAWSMYAAEHQGRLVSAYPNYGGFNGTWCAGNASIGGGAGAYSWGGADPAGIMQGLLWPYVKDLRVYRCSQDRRIATEGIAQFIGKPILRSISMNSYMNGASYGASVDWTVRYPGGPRDPNYPVFITETEITRPADTWVVMEEDPLSINDGMFLTDVGDYYRIIDLPSRLHDNGCWLNFADGHTEQFILRDLASLNWDLMGSRPYGGYNDWRRLVEIATHPLE